MFFIILFSCEDKTDMSLSERWILAQSLQLIALNDCLYRNMNKYKKVVVLDADELLVPEKIAPTSLNNFLK